MDLSPKLAWLIIGVVIAAWLALTVASIVSPDVEVPESINGLFLAIAGAAVAKLGSSNPKNKQVTKDKDGGDSE